MKAGLLSSLRSRPAFWMVAPFAVLLVLFSATSPAAPIDGNYVTAITSQCAIFLIFSCGLAAVSGAIEGSRGRRLRIQSLTDVRAPLRVAVFRLWPSVLCGSVVQLLGGLSVASGNWRASGTIPYILLATYAVVIVMHAVVGYGLGLSVRGAVSIPLALLLSYTWLGFTWSLNYFPLRYLSGLALANCCTATTALDISGPLATLAFSSLVLLAFGVLIGRRPQQNATARTTVARLLCLVVVAAGAISGLWIARDLGYSAVVPRAMAQARCEGHAPTICLFPEQISSPQTETLIREALDNLKGAGVAVPAQVLPYERESNAKTLYVYTNAAMSPGDLVHSLSASFLPQTLAKNCKGQNYDARLHVAGVLDYWLMAKASAGIVQYNQLSGVLPDGREDAAKLLAKPSADQRKWYQNNRRALSDCSVALRTGI